MYKTELIEEITVENVTDYVIFRDRKSCIGFQKRVKR